MRWLSSDSADLEYLRCMGYLGSFFDRLDAEEDDKKDVLWSNLFERCVP